MVASPTDEGPVYQYPTAGESSALYRNKPDKTTCSWRYREVLWTVCCIPDEEVANNRETPTWKKVCCVCCCIFGCGWCLFPITLCGACCIEPESHCPDSCPHPVTVCFQRQMIDFTQTFCVGK